MRKKEKRKMTVRIAVVEDEKKEFERLREMIETFASENRGMDFEFSYFPSGHSFLSQYRTQWNLIFLDIQMPGLNGMDLSKAIREKDRKVMLVFITNMAQYAIEGYDVQAYDFILKPLDYASFSMKFERICNSLKHNFSEAYIYLAFGGVKRQVKVSEITYIEVINHNLVVHLYDGEYRIRGTMTDMEKRLSQYHFMRCNACYLVNLKYVRELRGDYVVVDKSELRISHLKKSQFCGELAKYLGDSI